MGSTTEKIIGIDNRETEIFGIVRLLAYATKEAERLSLLETADFISLSIAALHEEKLRAQLRRAEKSGRSRSKPEN